MTSHSSADSLYSLSARSQRSYLRADRLSALLRRQRNINNPTKPRILNAVTDGSGMHGTERSIIPVKPPGEVIGVGTPIGAPTTRLNLQDVAILTAPAATAAS